MQRTLHLLTAVIVLTAAGLIGADAAAQSIRWTGHYYVAIGEAANGPAAVVGYHRGWNNAERIDALAPGEFVDFDVRQLPEHVPSLVPDHRYDVLAVAMTRLGPASVAGFESEGRPYFEQEPLPIPGIGAPHAVRSIREDYLVVAGRSPEGPVLTGDYSVAFGTPGKWYVYPGPDFRGGLFVDIAIAPSSLADDGADELVAVGSRDGRTFVVTGSLRDGLPTFYSAADLEVMPWAYVPVSIEWTGNYYVVMGVDSQGRTAMVYGHPGEWSESKTLLAAEMVPTDLALAPTTFGVTKPGKSYDLVAIGTLKGLVVTIAGEESDDSPTLYAGWWEVPDLLGIPSVTAPAPSLVSSATATFAAAAAPNPFASSTVLTLTLAREQAVLVEVFDTIGRRVAMLHNGVLAAGVPHPFAFEAGALPSGTYHFRVNGVDFSEVRTVTLAR